MPLERRAERLLAMLAAVRGAGDAPQPPAGPPRGSPRAGRDGRRRLGAARSAATIRSRDPAALSRCGSTRRSTRRRLTLPALVFFHGGGWVAGDLETHDGFCRRLCAAAGWRLVAVDYRLAPEHRFPSALDDCLAATRWTAANAAALGVDPARLGVGGDSVGAGLAAAVALALRGDGRLKLSLQLLVCPILDVGRTAGSRQAFAEGHFVSRAAFARDLADYASGVAAGDPRLSPLAAPSLVGLPPAVIHTAEFDPFRDEGEAYAVRLAGAAVPCATHRHAGMIHYFYALARAIPRAADAATLMGLQMQEMVGAAAVAA